MPEVKVDIEVWCTCGAGICHLATANRAGRGITVEPCRKCMEAEYERGHTEGYKDGGG